MILHRAIPFFCANSEVTLKSSVAAKSVSPKDMRSAPYRASSLRVAALYAPNCLFIPSRRTYTASWPRTAFQRSSMSRTVSATMAATVRAGKAFTTDLE